MCSVPHVTPNLYLSVKKIYYIVPFRVCVLLCMKCLNIPTMSMKKRLGLNDYDAELWVMGVRYTICKPKKTSLPVTSETKKFFTLKYGQYYTVRSALI